MSPPAQGAAVGSWGHRHAPRRESRGQGALPTWPAAQAGGGGWTNHSVPVIKSNTLPPNLSLQPPLLPQPRFPSHHPAPTWWCPVQVMIFSEPGRNWRSRSQTGTLRFNQSCRTFRGERRGEPGGGRGVHVGDATEPDRSHEEGAGVGGAEDAQAQWGGGGEQDRTVRPGLSLTFLARKMGSWGCCRSQTLRAFSFPPVPTHCGRAGFCRIRHTPGPTCSSAWQGGGRTSTGEMLPRGPPYIPPSLDGHWRRGVMWCVPTPSSHPLPGAPVRLCPSLPKQPGTSPGHSETGRGEWDKAPPQFPMGPLPQPGLLPAKDSQPQKSPRARL